MVALPPLKAVIFDLDGTLLNCPYDFAAMREAVLEIGSRFGVSKEELAHFGILEAIEAGAARVGEEFRRQAKEAVLSLELAGARDSRPLPGARETLAWLKAQGLKVGIITRNSEKVAGELLQRAEFNYDLLLAREAVSRVKPHPNHVQEMLKRLRCLPAEAIMVGDHIWDINSGKEAGLICVGVTGGAASKEALLEAGAKIVLGNLASLPAWLEEHLSFPGGESI